MKKTVTEAQEGKEKNFVPLPLCLCPLVLVKGDIASLLYYRCASKKKACTGLQHLVQAFVDRFKNGFYLTKGQRQLRCSPPA